ncbi:IniB N-terminal domain-containing protein [Lentzea sp. BCCO 10_0061]|uniref:IniB N-terminal domain-containing protein n=1 Tax=Lentzea sokolovensis TaxID=3095429 RepID=A0ABU4V4D0_9PSEU|nr:IniB N-terminal domain-containing protein [Lentzea sp. BCCO 10_0061]MDX8146638.1 IniB N-terminal domain-containing protein [Lentzea sp. BCCO 10_0061]
MATQTTLHDFTLNLLGDLDAREAFQLDPEGTLEAAGLGDISPVDVHEILPLVLDSASVVKIDAIDKVLVEAGDLTAVDSLKLITGNIEGVTGIADVAAPSAITALVTDFGGLGDVTGTLDVVNANEVVSDVTGIAHDNSVVSTVTDVADVHGVTDVVVKDLDADVLVKDVVDSDVLVKNVIGSADVDVKDVLDVTDNVTGNVVQDVAQVGDVHNDLGQVVGDVKVGDIDLLDGGIGNGADLDIHF